MSNIRITAVTAVVAVGLVFGSMPVALGKAHDQGKADGVLCPVCSGTETNSHQQILELQAAGALDSRGVSLLQRDGVRGDKSKDGQKAGGVNCIPTGSSLPCPAQ